MKLIRLFIIRREERWPALGALVYIVLLNALVVGNYADKFFSLSKNYHKLFTHNFLVSGFDPLSYVVLSDWGTRYNIYRHPLLAFFMWPAAMLNKLCMTLLGVNMATVIMALLLTVSALYGFVFLRRILREVIGTGAHDATLLAALCFSFAYVMVSISVPDHFSLSMTLLILTLYLAGRKMKRHQPLTIVQTVALFVVTAGISLNNGVKIFLANLFTNGRRFWRPSNLLLAILLPAALMWAGARWEWHVFEEPSFHARQVAKEKKDAALREKIVEQVRDTISVRDPVAITKAANRIIQKRAHDKAVRDHKKAWNRHKGKPMGNGEFSQWTDISTPRMASLVGNWFGESIQLHQDHLLGDTLRSRPVIVNYRWWFNYVVEALLVALFLAGVWCGRRKRFLWLALSFMGFDLFIHMVLGFGLNEVYIMSPHWLFIMPIAMGYLFKQSAGRKAHKPLAIVTGLTTLYLLVWNIALYISHFV